MSKPTKPSEKDLLDWFDGACSFLALHGWTECDERAVAIRRIIGEYKNAIETWVKEAGYAINGKWPRFVKDKLLMEIRDFGKEREDAR